MRMERVCKYAAGKSSVVFPFRDFLRKESKLCSMSEEKPDDIPAIQVNHRYKVHFGRLVHLSHHKGI